MHKEAGHDFPWQSVKFPGKCHPFALLFVTLVGHKVTEKVDAED